MNGLGTNLCQKSISFIWNHRLDEVLTCWESQGQDKNLGIDASSGMLNDTEITPEDTKTEFIDRIEAIFNYSSRLEISLQ
jgi:hypothetical protein